MTLALAFRFYLETAPRYRVQGITRAVRHVFLVTQYLPLSPGVTLPNKVLPDISQQAAVSRNDESPDHPVKDDTYIYLFCFHNVIIYGN